MTDCQTYRGPFAALVLVAALLCGAGAASAATKQVTLDFGTEGSTESPYVEDGFEVRSDFLYLFRDFGNPSASLMIDTSAYPITLKRTNDGPFSLISFDYYCSGGECDFSVGGTWIRENRANDLIFATASPIGFTDVTSIVFTKRFSSASIDNIVLSYDDGVAPIPLPAGLPLLLSVFAGLGLMAWRKSRAA